jgi:hypothetical protein
MASTLLVSNEAAGDGGFFFGRPGAAVRHRLR